MHTVREEILPKPLLRLMLEEVSYGAKLAYMLAIKPGRGAVGFVGYAEGQMESP